ncbi:hypothetical protein [Luteibacter sp. 329MFSha]|uniref:hypothetical protein n=1 Tax=Luteibacter sp. 329MFSha TaxID=1798239 RepID=UPI0008B9B649|nr:hypothetical protein [Luteibacter sp. 329MFSha]SEV92148.1 hypothetical protein SAMN04515660_0985 [Luteibacter sp. 329MFSha]
MIDRAGWLSATPLARAMRDSPWLYPAVETVHIVGFCILVGAVAMFDLRVLGWGRALPVSALGRHLLPWSAGSVALVLPAGLMMFSTQPQAFLGNPLFLLKLTLIALAGVNALVFHVGVYRSVAAWETTHPAPSLARMQASLSLVLWLAVIACGRMLAYY